MTFEKSCGAVVFRNDRSSGELKRYVLMIKHSSFGHYSFPKGHVEVGESEKMTAEREVMEETNVDIANTCYAKRYNIAVFDEPNRDTRQRVLSFLSTAVISGSTNAVAGDDAAELKWFSVRNLPPLAFDHMSMINKARKEHNF